ncbi:MAG: dihydroorotate dehydrogenase 2 [Actinomycetota bacterium]
MGLYRSVFRPLLFALPPETAHRLALAILRVPLPWRRIGGVEGDPRLRTDLAGIALSNPVGLAAGFDKNFHALRALGELGFGYVVGGTVSRALRKGNSPPRIVRLKGRDSMVNAMGLPNDGAVAAANRLQRLEKASPVLISLADEEPGDVVANYELLAPFVDGFELNVSSPNSPWRRDRDNQEHLRKMLVELSARRARPLFVKLPPFHVPEERDAVLALAGIAAEGGADGLTCSNTRPAEEPRLAAGKGGLSGSELIADTPEIVSAVRGETGLPVNASGGIFSAEDAAACIDAGATTVQVYTGLIYEGPRIVRNITLGLLPGRSSEPLRDARY